MAHIQLAYFKLHYLLMGPHPTTSNCPGFFLVSEGSLMAFYRVVAMLLTDIAVELSQNVLTAWQLDEMELHYSQFFEPAQKYWVDVHSD